MTSWQDRPSLPKEIKSTLVDNEGNTQNAYTRKSSCVAGISPGDLSKYSQPSAPVWGQTLWSVVFLLQSFIVLLHQEQELKYYDVVSKSPKKQGRGLLSIQLRQDAESLKEHEFIIFTGSSRRN